MVVLAIQSQPNLMKEKYIYNKQTLQFEKIEINWKDRLIKIFGLFSAFVVTSMLCYPLFQQLFPSAEVQSKNKEIEQLGFRYNALQKHVETMDKAVESLHQRSNGVYRRMFNMDPIDESVWASGVGGHDKYANLAKFSSSQTIMETQDRIELLSRQIALQSKSLDTIANMVKEKENMLKAIPNLKPVREDKLHESMGVLSGFGVRIHPIYKVRKFHKGIDFSADSGTAIQATGDGEVVQAGRDGGYGNCVIIRHGYGYETLYGHMSKIDVHVGQKVKRGQRIGLIGSTGAATGPHCHYEVHLNGDIVNPLPYCLDGLTPSEYALLVKAATAENNSFD